jgi:hypothetical protein
MPEIDYTDPDATADLFIGDPNGGDGGVRTNGGGEDTHDETGDPCSSCGQPLDWDPTERMTYCVNDWSHG